MKVGVLALQGAFAAHARVLGRAGADPVEVRGDDALASVDALVLPGGESTTMGRLLATSGLFEPLAARVAAGLPTFGTCAGLILLAREVLDGRPDQRSLGAIDLTVRRNGYGRQVDSFEAPLDLSRLGLVGPFEGVFIRAPVVEAVGAEVEVLATVDGAPVLCRQGSVVVASFHPELAGDERLHRWFLDHVAGSPAPDPVFTA